VAKWRCVFVMAWLVAWAWPALGGEGVGPAELKDKAFLNLWPDKAPGALGDTPEDTPAIQVFLPKAGTASGSSFIVCPGGGYGGRAGGR